MTEREHVRLFSYAATIPRRNSDSIVSFISISSPPMNRYCYISHLHCDQPRATSLACTERYWPGTFMGYSLRALRSDPTIKGNRGGRVLTMTLAALLPLIYLLPIAGTCDGILDWSRQPLQRSSSKTLTFRSKRKEKKKEIEHVSTLSGAGHRAFLLISPAKKEHGARSRIPKLTVN